MNAIDKMSKVRPTTERRPVPMKNGVRERCTLVTCRAVAIPVVMKAADKRY